MYKRQFFNCAFEDEFFGPRATTVAESIDIEGAQQCGLTAAVSAGVASGFGFIGGISGVNPAFLQRKVSTVESTIENFLTSLSDVFLNLIVTTFEDDETRHDELREIVGSRQTSR